MVFTPTVPTGGLAGLRFLTRTFDRQMEIFSKGPVIEREIRHFLERAVNVTTVDDLLADRQLLKVALGAFGLEDEVEKRALIRRILEDGTLDPRSFANRLADPRWKEFSKTMGFGDFGGNLYRSAVRDDIVARYRVRQFERAVGEVDVDLRLALNFRREIQTIASSPSADRSGWFEIMGSRPLRSVIEGAFNLPESFGRFDIDDQRSTLEDRARKFLGDKSVKVFQSERNVERLVERYLLKSQAQRTTGFSGAGATALTLLSSRGLGPIGQANIIESSVSTFGR